jgi:DNA-binding transcriptional ArsR family regulator
MKEFIRVMKALSDPTRVKILKILEKRLMCVCEIQTAIGAAQSTASKHLKYWKMRDLWNLKRMGCGSITPLLTEGRVLMLLLFWAICGTG